MANIQGITNALSSPAATPDGTQTPNALRTGKYNEQYAVSLVPTKHLAALSGYYYCGNAGSTAVVTSLQTLTEASPALIIENSYSGQAPGPNILMDYVRLKCLAADTNTTTWAYGWKTDNIRGKWGSAGTAITPQNANMGATNSSVATVHFGALVVATAQQSSNNARLVADGFLAPTASAAATVLGDMVEFQFGNLEAPLPTVTSNVASNGAHTFAMCYSVNLAPVVIPPGCTLTLFLFSASAGAIPSYELNMGWFEY